jgi:hypothetical protein
MRRILPDPSDASSPTCPRCGSVPDPNTTFCPVCGHGIGNAQSSTPSYQPTPPSSSSLVPSISNSSGTSPKTGSANQRKSLREYFGWRAIDGTVIHVGQSQVIRAPRHWWKLLLKLAIVIIALAAFGTLALIVLVFLFAFSLLLAWLFPRYERRQGGFLQSVATQFVAFFLTSRLLGQKPTIPACDYRLRDSNGTEYLVRVEGYVRTGGMNVGDAVLAEGYDRQGTLVMKQGWNRRLGTLIRVKEK